MTEGETGSTVVTAKGSGRRRVKTDRLTGPQAISGIEPGVVPGVVQSAGGSAVAIGRASSALRSDEAARVFRYGVVSATNIVGHQAILFLANSVGGMSGGPANALAATIMCVPAYFLSRNWVWQVDGSHSVKFQVLPFWIITVVGLIVSTAMAAAAQAVFGAGLVVNFAAFLGYFLVWIAKFLVLERLFGRHAAS